MGPVPNNFNSLFEYMANMNWVEINCTTFADGGVGEQFMANTTNKFSAKLFSERELGVLNRIADHFLDTNTQNIIELSHQEKGWYENEKERKLIDYSYGFELVGI